VSLEDDRPESVYIYSYSKRVGGGEEVKGNFLFGNAISKVSYSEFHHQLAVWIPLCYLGCPSSFQLFLMMTIYFIDFLHPRRQSALSAVAPLLCNSS